VELRSDKDRLRRHVMGVHFRHEIVEAGKWRRYCNPRGDHGSTNEARHHFIAQTERAQLFIKLDASEVMGNTGLCPGYVALEDGTEVLAYRFLFLGANEQQLEMMLGDLDREVERFREYLVVKCGH
jgi:hypothetical protein